MRSITAAQQGVIDAGVQADFVRVSIKDSGGTFRDLTTYIPGFNPVKTVQWKTEVNSPCATFELTLARELYQLSLAPLVDNGVNRNFNPSTAFAPLLQAGREVKIEAAVVAMDTQPLAGDWMEVFRGQVDSVDSASGWDVHVSGRDLAGRLALQYIKLERVYSFAVDTGVPKSARQWSPQMVVVAGEYLIPASRGAATSTAPADPGYNKILKCHTGGTTGTVEPVWTTGALQADGGTVKWDYVGAPSTAGFPVETIIQQILDDNRLSGDPAVTLLTPSSPVWNITQFMQSRGFTLDGGRALSTQIGWDLRYKWDAGGSSFRFTLYQPNRSSPSVDHTFATKDYENPSKLSVDIATIRNSVRVIYADKTDLFPDGTPKRKVIDVADSASITKYNQELWMELQEDENGNIDSPTEATTLANAALSDCSEPTAELSVPLTRGFLWTELCDYYTFTANNLHFTSDQSLAVTSVTQTFEKARLKTVLELRGKPTIGAAVHLAKEFHPHGKEKMATHRQQQFQGAATASLSLADTIGGKSIKIQVDKNGKNTLLAEYEIHVYPTPGTTLDPTTLAGLSTSQNFIAGDLDSGDTYYTRGVPRYYNAGQLVRGEPTAEVSFVPGYLRPKHIFTEEFKGETPLNGSFEGFTRSLGTNVPPDQWEVVTGAWGTEIAAGPAKSGAVAIDGARYIRFTNASNTASKIRSKWFPVSPSHIFEFAMWLHRVSTDAGPVDMEIEWVTSTKGAISTSQLQVNINTFTADTWNFVRTTMASPSTAAFARVNLSRHNAANYQFHFDGVKVVDCGEKWHEVGATGEPAFQNSWVNFNAASHATAAFRFSNGLWHMKGLIKSGTVGVGTPAFTLPAVAFPPLNVNFACIDGTDKGNSRVEIDAATGTVTVLTGTNTYISLDGIRWAAF